VTRTDDGRVLGGATVSEEPSGPSVATDLFGFYALWAPGVAAGTSRLTAAASGFADPGLPADSSLRLAPVAGGALLGRRIALDPEGGGDDPAGEGPSGVRASTVNLAVARLVRDDLERAGAQVLLTRESEASTPVVARVQAAERFHAERVVRIGLRAGAPSAVGYYPGSNGGRELARRVHRRQWAAEEADTLRAAAADSTADGARRPPVLVEDANYVLQQTSCPAVSVRLGDLSRPDDEARFLDPAWRHGEAYLIVSALAEDLGALGDSLATVRLFLTDRGAPVAGASIRLDGFALVSDARGQAAFALLDRRVRHLLEVAWGGGRGESRAWLDPAQGLAWEWSADRPAPLPRKP
jgi:N-acetylmuramoyl-L-alanine amidase